jgi:ketosteroid isomerase-like protein
MKCNLLLLCIACGLLSVAMPAGAQAVSADEAAIRAAISAQSEAWNRADIPGFMQTYEDSPETTFMGKSSLKKGTKEIQNRYALAYNSPARMGKLTFKDIEVHILPTTCGESEFAYVTGKFHLDRPAVEGQSDDGSFSLIWRKTLKGWKIILDHTTSS